VARADLRHVFDHVHLPTEDNKRVRGIVARCGTYGCGAGVAMPVNTQNNGGGQDDEVEWRFIARKLEAKGWSVGRRKQDHRCPRCQRNAKLVSPKPAAGPVAVAPKKEDPMNSTTIKPPPRTPAGLLTPPEREMSRDDRRIIFAKLEEVYVDGKVGYADGWSDAEVAKHLGVPRSWVRVIRDENFGEEITSENTRAKIAECLKLIGDIKKLAPSIDEAKKLVGLADKMEKDIAAIAKAMGVTT
jgi:hypothetical protein